MEATRTKEASARSYRSLIAIVVALAVVLSIAMVNASTQGASTGVHGVTTTLAPTDIPRDPAARIQLQIAAARERLAQQQNEGTNTACLRCSGDRAKPAH